MTRVSTPRQRMLSYIFVLVFGVNAITQLFLTVSAYPRHTWLPHALLCLLFTVVTAISIVGTLRLRDPRPHV